LLPAYSLLLQELRTYFAPPGNRDVVEQKWVKDAMNNFVKIRLARKTNENDRFVIEFKKVRTEDTTLQFFAKKLYGDLQSLDAYLENKRVSTDTTDGALTQDSS
jgi:hypothetical protein